MLFWLVAVLAGTLAAVVQYHFVGQRAPATRALRAVAFVVVLALIFDVPVAPAHRARPYVALDVSASWSAGGDSTLWKRALRSADSLGGDTLLLVGDSVRTGAPPAAPADVATRTAPLVERALGAGRPAVFITDGLVDDADRLAELPSGSHIVALAGTARPDAAIASLDGPSAAVSGDTIELTVVVSAGGAGAPRGRVDLSLGGTSVGSSVLDSLAPYAEREVRVRTPVQGPPGSRLLRAVWTAPGDAIAANDTLSAVLDVARGASAVFVSTAPDYDARYALGVLRGTLAVPTRGYFRVAPGQWRVDGSLAPVAGEEVRRNFAEAQLAVLHGDTALFGPPRALTRGALVLLVPPPARGDDFYALGAPPSPLAAALGGLPWDSLPPVELGLSPRNAEWVGVSTRRARRFDERPLLTGSSKPRRVVVVPAGGLWRWRFQGGRSADAFTALWGSVFDWMMGDNAVDARAAHPATAWIRAGEPVRWRRGSARDTAATIVLRRRGAVRADTLLLRFGGEGGVAESPPLPPGLYDVQTAGGTGLLAVNVSSEWIPRRPSVRSGSIGVAPSADRAPRARTAWWLYALALAALCAEWVLRRRIGLR